MKLRRRRRSCVNRETDEEAWSSDEPRKGKRQRVKKWRIEPIPKWIRNIGRIIRRRGM
jgi:hypothetical protein